MPILLENLWIVSTFGDTLYEFKKGVPNLALRGWIGGVQKFMTFDFTNSPLYKIIIEDGLFVGTQIPLEGDMGIFDIKPRYFSPEEEVLEEQSPIDLDTYEEEIFLIARLKKVNFFQKRRLYPIFINIAWNIREFDFKSKDSHPKLDYTLKKLFKKYGIKVISEKKIKKTV